MELNDATVLIVDDEPALLEIFSGWIGKEARRVLTAKNGAEALELTQGNHVDVVISDVRMPVMDGVTFARRLHQAGRYTPKIVFISGFSDLEPREAYDLGIECMLGKPVRKRQIISVLRACLEPRATLWAQPPAETPARELVETFDSVQEALERGQLGFGRGGFCVATSLAAKEDETIGLNLSFAANHHRLIGAGAVRWTDYSVPALGIEILYIEEAERPWVVNLAEANASNSFIPKTPSKP